MQVEITPEHAIASRTTIKVGGGGAWAEVTRERRGHGVTLEQDQAAVGVPTGPGASVPLDSAVLGQGVHHAHASRLHVHLTFTDVLAQHTTSTLAGRGGGEFQ